MESSKVDRFLTKEGKGFGRRKDSAVYQDTRAKKTEKEPDTHRPVSYTHLDVYKRQSKTCSEAGAGINPQKA